jgi:hypothetical protein
MKPFIAGAAAAVGSLALLAGCRDSRLEASAPRSLETAADAGAPMLVHCGEGRQALVRTVQVGGRTVPQVECVALAASTADLPAAAYAQPLVQPALYRTPVVPVVEPAAAPSRVVYRERPVTRRVAYRQAEPARRSWKKSALIIGGAAAGGAGLGAVIDGGKGAKKGAVIGGVAGTIYDLATRDKR